jgi:hypothetical protein
MFVPITDKELVKKLEQETSSIENIIYNHANIEPLDANAAAKLYFKILRWSHDWNIEANDSVFKKWSKLSELLGFKPVYYPVHVNKNALWAFYWKDDPVLLYYEIRGMRIQVGGDFNESKIIPFLIYLKNKITDINKRKFLTKEIFYPKLNI